MELWSTSSEPPETADLRKAAILLKIATALVSPMGDPAKEASPE
jgi:hypothetical protein